MLICIYSGEHVEKLSQDKAENEYVIQPMLWSLIPHFHKVSIVYETFVVSFILKMSTLL